MKGNVISPCFPRKDLLSRCFLSFVFRFSVSSLFLLHILSIKLFCISITYWKLTRFQEEYHDNYWHEQMPRSNDWSARINSPYPIAQNITRKSEEHRKKALDNIIRHIHAKNFLR